MEGARTQSGHGLKAWSVDGLGLGTRERQLGECKAAGHALLDLASLSPLRAPLSPQGPLQTWKEGVAASTGSALNSGRKLSGVT